MEPPQFDEDVLGLQKREYLAKTEAHLEGWKNDRYDFQITAFQDFNLGKASKSFAWLLHLKVFNPK